MDFGVKSHSLPQALADSRPIPMALNDDISSGDYDFPERGFGQGASLEVVRELTEEDLKAPRPKPSPPPSIKTLRTSHHRVAQLLAQGIEPIDVSLITGTSINSIRRLQKDPTFLGLLEHYLGVTELKLADVVERMREIGQDALDVLHERLSETPDKFNNNQLLAIAETLIVRPLVVRNSAVGGGTGTPVGITINFRSPGNRPEVDCIEVEEVK